MKNVFTFLKKLKANNNKDWFDAHKEDYLEAKEEFEAYINEILTGIKKFDKQIDPSLTAKQCTFRIYKDVRFSKDKTPYKTNMGASMNPGGKKSLTAGYYLHCEPGGSFLAGGVYMPEPDMLSAIRQEIDYNPQPLLKLMKAAPFKKYFKGLDEEDKLKTVPKGYDKTHPHIEILKNKHFLVSHYFSDKDMLDPKNSKNIIEGFKAMYPFLEYLRKAQEK
ncbi:MAG: hypothetical protein K0S12_530 [Bacteroidetes bacterium]|jgi:uncharacterized protein (TIGR02453 family)|nr:hypothetical protein [Bacteroidota bacterium]